MSEILIKGMELPKEIQCCYTIFPNGKVIVHWDGKVLGEAKAIEVQPHGDLIERSLALGACYEMSRFTDMDGAFEVVENIPTVIEGSKERE